ncbi:response regulator [Catenovulum sediminis]|uniref:Response regulator transcription factor n=1 Tax=Catenovulum sediminis TaxID=1740262 RepID=A0ABV1RN02_9ALTE|nr:response regulator transcription factor [Catenovulum sediminis]
MADKRRIVLIDDHHLVRAGLRSLLEDTEGYEVVGEGDDGSVALDLIASRQPDVLITDIAMKHKTGLAILPDIKRQYPDLPVILLSMHASKDYLQEAFEKGAQAYLLKDSAEIELELALAAVFRGERYVSPKLSEAMLEALSGNTQEADGQPKQAIPLTDRQIEILRLIALGKGTKEIAFDLHLSAKTIESHRAQIMERLGIRDVANLVRYALKTGIIDLDEE